MKRITPLGTPVLFFAILLFAGCAAEQNGSEVDAGTAQSEIEAVNAQFESYVSAQQWDSLMTLYTEDAVVLPQGAPMEEGKSAIRAGFEQMGQMGPFQMDLETVDVEVAGSSAYEVGTYSIQTPDGMEVDNGKYLVVWKNVDGEWKLHRDAYNSNMQPGEAGQMPSDTTATDTTMTDTTSAM